MKVKLILPSLTEAKSPLFRPIKYSLFPPLGLATLAAFLPENADIDLRDEHVEPLDLNDDPDLVIIQVYITNASRAYRYADHYRQRGAHVCLGGLHVTSLPDEAAAHADTIFLGPGEHSFPEFLKDFQNRRPKPRYHAPLKRDLDHLPPIRRDLIKRNLYLVPNSISVTRGCPHHCDFCYKDAFFGKGTGFYVRKVDEALAEIDRLPGKHVYFLDDHLFGHPRFAAALFDGMKGMNRVFQGAATVSSLAKPGLLEKAADAGMRAVFVGFENLNPDNMRRHGKIQNLGRDYHTAIRRARENGLMVNGSFVFGMDGDDPDVFSRTTDWAVQQGIETATFHVMTPYPGTALFHRMRKSRRLLHEEWDLYDTRHAVFQPARMTPRQLETGYQNAYRRFYSLQKILEGALGKSAPDTARHLAYSIAWKKCEWIWQTLIRMKQVSRGLPLLENTLDLHSKRRRPAAMDAATATPKAATTEKLLKPTG